MGYSNLKKQFRTGWDASLRTGSAVATTWHSWRSKCVASCMGRHRWATGLLGPTRWALAYLLIHSFRAPLHNAGGVVLAVELRQVPVPRPGPGFDQARACRSRT